MLDLPAPSQGTETKMPLMPKDFISPNLVRWLSSISELVCSLSKWLQQLSLSNNGI